MEGENACEDQCINVLGSYRCECTKEGYTVGLDGRTCDGKLNWWGVLNTLLYHTDFVSLAYTLHKVYRENIRSCMVLDLFTLGHSY